MFVCRLTCPQTMPKRCVAVEGGVDIAAPASGGFRGLFIPLVAIGLPPWP